MTFSTAPYPQPALNLLQAYELCAASERQALDQHWRAGRLQRHVPCLLRFLQRNRQRLHALQAERPDLASLVDRAKVLVAESGVVDHRAEAIDQIREIETEIWIQGERGNRNRERIASDWATHHARVWRDWRLKEYFYVLERIAPQLDTSLPE